MKIEKIADKIVYNENTISKRVIFNEDKILNFVLNLRPGQGVPSHNHENSDMIVYVLSGKGEMVVDEKIQDVREGDVIHCHGDEMFSLKNIGDNDMSCFVVLTPNPSQIYSKEF